MSSTHEVFWKGDIFHKKKNLLFLRGLGRDSLEPRGVYNISSWHGLGVGSKFSKTPSLFLPYWWFETVNPKQRLNHSCNWAQPQISSLILAITILTVNLDIPVLGQVLGFVVGDVIRDIPFPFLPLLLFCNLLFFFAVMNRYVWWENYIF